MVRKVLAEISRLSACLSTSGEVGERGGGSGLTDELDGLVDGVHLLGLGLDHVDLSLLVSGNESGRLDNRSGLEGSDGDRGEQGRVQEVVVRRDDSLREDRDVRMVSQVSIGADY